jgi:hypothetical protein
MSIKNGFDSIRCLLNNIPNTQASGVWVGSGTQLTTLNKGVYFVNYNVSYIPSTGAITNSQTVITTGLSFVGGGQIVASTPVTGAMGVTGASAMRQTLSNTFIVTTDNTPIFVYLSCTVSAGTWGSTNVNEQSLNIVSFTKISSL